MPDRTIKISVIVPVCNAEKYLKEALDSVFKQSFTDWELILVDNMSKDNSLSICESYAQTDDRVCIYKEEKNGAGAARNTGMKMARGEYLCFLDADDCLAGTDILQKLAEHLGLAPEQVIAVGDSRNDLSMIRYAGTGLAVANACDELKQAANAVACTSDAGVLSYIYHHFVE